MREPLTTYVWEGHLYNPEPIGTYPVVDDQTVWSCIDIDFDDYPLALEMQAQLARVGIRGWIESSRSKGWHVWVFWDDWLPCKYSRSLLLWLVDDLGHPKMEVNPKNFHLDQQTLGNYVRLPYPFRPKHTGRQRMVVAGESMDLFGFIDLDIAGEVRTPVSVARSLAPHSPFFPKPYQFREDRQGGGKMGKGGSWMQQECARYLTDDKSVIPVGRRDEMFFAIANLMHGLFLDIDKATRMMTTIWEFQTEDNRSYPLHLALEKLERRYAQ